MKMNLFELVENKAFETLNQEEKAFVLQHLTEKEYSNKHELIQQSRRHFSEEAQHLNADEKIRATALSHLRKRKSKKRISPIFSYKIPAWAAIAAVLLVLFMSLSYQYFSSMPETQRELLTASNDTVYLERVLTDTVKIFSPPDTVFKERKVYSTKKASRLLTTVENDQNKNVNGLRAASSTLLNAELERKIIVDLKVGQKYSGTSLREDSIAQMLMGVRLM